MNTTKWTEIRLKLEELGLEDWEINVQLERYLNGLPLEIDGE